LLLENKFPRLFSFARDKLISVQKFLPKWLIFSTYPYLNKHGKNIKLCRSLSKRFKSQNKVKTTGVIYGAKLNILHPNFTIFSSVA
jgi:hypothetical protein